MCTIQRPRLKLLSVRLSPKAGVEVLQKPMCAVPWCRPMQLIHGGPKKSRSMPTLVSIGRANLGEGPLTARFGGGNVGARLELG